MTDTTNPCAVANCGHPEADHSRLAGCTAVPAGKTFCLCSGYRAGKGGPTEATPPVTPYDGGTSSGHSGTDTSAARAQREDTDGTTKRRQQRVLDMLGQAGTQGVTVKVLREATGWHHGQASAALSNLHQGGLIARLVEVRDRCKVYTLPTFVADRDTEPHGVRQSKAKGRKTQGQVTLTAREADALRRLFSRASTEAVSTIVDVSDLRLLTNALRLRDDKPARSE